MWFSTSARRQGEYICSSWFGIKFAILEKETIDGLVDGGLRIVYYVE